MWRVDFGLCGHSIFVIRTLDFGWVDVRLLWCGHWNMGVTTLDLGCMDVGFHWMDVGFGCLNVG